MTENYNPTVGSFEKTFPKASRKRRFVAFVIDHFFMIFLITLLVPVLASAGFAFLSGPAYVLLVIFLCFVALALYFAKDSVNGISLGKWSMGIMVRNEDDNTVKPSFSKLFLRNLTLVIWPAEIIIMIINNDKRRLGDKIANAVVVRNPDKPGKLPRVLVFILAFVLLIVSFVVFLAYTLSHSDAFKVATTEIQKNKAIQKEVGGIVSFGKFPSSNINVSNDKGNAKFRISVVGKKDDMTVNVYLIKEAGVWKVIKME